MRSLKYATNSQKGFTIVELMIATAILSVILLLSTIMITGIGNLYYKGVNQSRIQDDVRTITDDVAQHLELSSGSQPLTTGSAPHSPYNTFNAYCIAGTRYSYVVGIQIGSGANQIKHVLWRDSINGICSPVDLTQLKPSIDGTELIASNSRLTDFTISLKSPYSISIAAAYGDNDLLCSPAVMNTCSGGVQLSAANYVPPKVILCKGSAGGQFCATASLITTAVQRLN